MKKNKCNIKRKNRKKQIEKYKKKNKINILWYTSFIFITNIISSIYKTNYIIKFLDMLKNMFNYY